MSKEKKYISPIGEDWNDYQKRAFTKEEIEQSAIRVAIIESIIAARKTAGLTQADLGKMTGISQPVISRLEQGNVHSNIDTLIKILTPLGKTLKIVDVNQITE